jgi:vitamin B12 transporter
VTTLRRPSAGRVPGRLIAHWIFPRSRAAALPSEFPQSSDAIHEGAMRRRSVCLLILVIFSIAGFQPSLEAADPNLTSAAVGTAGTSNKKSNAGAISRKPQPDGKKSGQTRSESSSVSTSRKLPTIVVTATRIRQPISEIGTTVTVMDSHQIESQKIEQTGNVLRQVPGVQVFQSGSPGTLTDVSIRGATPAETLVMIDGVEVNSGSTGSFDLGNVTTNGLSQIEVVRGAGGALYGSQAIGGVVNLLTSPGSGPPTMSLQSEGGNRATQRQVMTAQGSNGDLAYNGTLTYFSTEGYRSVNDNSDLLSGALRLDYEAGEDTTLRGFARYYRANTSLATYANFITPVDPNAHQRDEFMLYKGEVEHRFGTRLKLDVSTYFVRNQVNLNSLPFPAYPAFEVDRLPDEIRGTNWEAQYSWTRNFRSVAGFDFKDRWARVLDEYQYSGTPMAITQFPARRQEYAGYFEQEAALFEGLVNLTSGFRVDGNSQFGEEVSPSWAVSIPIRRWGTTLRGSYSEGFRAPAFNELYYPFFGNPDLKPEISSEYDGGVTQQIGRRLTVTATYFSRRVHDLIVTVPCSTCKFGVEAGNAERVDSQGVEFVPSLKIFQGLNFSGNFTYIDETHSSISPMIRPIRVPKYSAFSLLQYVHRGLWLSDDKVESSVAYFFVGDRDDIDPATSEIVNHGAYSRVDLVASYSAGVRWGLIGGEQAFVRVVNLLDRNYSEVLGFKSPTLNFVAGIKLEFKKE